MLALLVTAFPVALAVLGASRIGRGGRLGPLGWSLAGLFVLLAGSMAAILLLAGSGRRFGPLPAGLAVLLLGLGLAAFVLTSIAYAATFARSGLPPSEEG